MKAPCVRQFRFKSCLYFGRWRGADCKSPFRRVRSYTSYGHDLKVELGLKTSSVNSLLPVLVKWRMCGESDCPSGMALTFEEFNSLIHLLFWGITKLVKDGTSCVGSSQLPRYTLPAWRVASTLDLKSNVPQRAGWPPDFTPLKRCFLSIEV